MSFKRTVILPVLIQRFFLNFFLSSGIGEEQFPEIDFFPALIHQFHLDVIEKVRRGYSKRNRNNQNCAKQNQQYP